MKSREGTRIVSPAQLDAAEAQLRSELHRVRLKHTEQRSLVLRAFLATTEPVSVTDLLYLVKKEDLNIAFTTVYRTLKVIVDCGMGQAVSSPRGVTHYEHEYNRCRHRHLVCKDCGSVIEAKAEDMEVSEVGNG
jgi:Fur family ferric uptake transcriptional regulator